ncbi:MAG: hypothetical protein R3F59_36605, partial [Myxococcota bacterium]
MPTLDALLEAAAEQDGEEAAVTGHARPRPTWDDDPDDPVDAAPWLAALTEGDPRDPTGAPRPRDRENRAPATRPPGEPHDEQVPEPPSPVAAVPEGVAEAVPTPDPLAEGPASGWEGADPEVSALLQQAPAWALDLPDDDVAAPEPAPERAMSDAPEATATAPTPAPALHAPVAAEPGPQDVRPEPARAPVPSAAEVAGTSVAPAPETTRSNALGYAPEPVHVAPLSPDAGGSADAEADVAVAEAGRQVAESAPQHFDPPEDSPLAALAAVGEAHVERPAADPAAREASLAASAQQVEAGLRRLQLSTLSAVRQATGTAPAGGPVHEVHAASLREMAAI